MPDLPTNPRGVVKLAPTLNGVVIAPEQPAHMSRLAQSIAAQRPTLRLQRSAEGFWVSSGECPALVGIGEGTLTWTDEAECFVANRSRLALSHKEVRARVQAVID